MNNSPIGSKQAGYATPDMGPFQCSNCIHFGKTSETGDNSGSGRCNHPEVISDPEVKGEVQPLGCCNYFRNRTGMGQKLNA